MQTAVISGPRNGVVLGPVSRARASAVTHRVRAVACSQYPHGKLFPPANRLENTYTLKSRRPGHQNSRPQACQQTAALPAAIPPPLTTGPWKRLLPACKLLAVLICMPLVLEALAQGSQQWCLLALAGVLLPLHSMRSTRSLKQWQHIMQAAATAEAETEEQPAEPDTEEPNDNTVMETGAELGNVQTPASVWLPYATGQNGKVLNLHSQLPFTPPLRTTDAKPGL